MCQIQWLIFIWISWFHPHSRYYYEPHFTDEEIGFHSIERFAQITQLRISKDGVLAPGADPGAWLCCVHPLPIITSLPTAPPYRVCPGVWGVPTFLTHTFPLARADWSRLFQPGPIRVCLLGYKEIGTVRWWEICKPKTVDEQRELSLEGKR